MFKKTFVFLAVALALCFGLVGTGHVQAVSGLTFQSGVQVVNLDQTNPAHITLDYYGQTTGTKDYTATDTIPAKSSKTYFPIAAVPAGFNGSLVISSDVPVVAIANTQTPSGTFYGDSNNSFSAGSTTFNLPLVMCNNSGFDTLFNVQNAGGSDANITITYIPGATGKTGVTESATIKPGAAKTFDQSLGSATKNCTDLADTVTGKFIGSATITSNVPVVASVMQIGTGGFKVMMNYNGFAQGSQVINLPLVMANNSTFYTSYQIQNVGTVTTNVTVTYSTYTTLTPTSETFSLAAGSSKTIQMVGSTPGNGSANNWATMGRYIGSAIITNSAAQPLVAIVNQTSGGFSGKGPFGGSYSGFDPNAATVNVVMPLLYANNSSWYTSFQVANVGTGACNISVTYSANTAGAFTPVAETITGLAAGTSNTIQMVGTSPGNGSANTWDGQGIYIGSATAVGTGTGCAIAAIVNQQNVTTAGGDKFFTYGAFNY